MPHARMTAPIAIITASTPISRIKSKSKIFGMGGGGLVGVGVFSHIVPSQARRPKESINPPIMTRIIPIIRSTSYYRISKHFFKLITFYMSIFLVIVKILSLKIVIALNISNHTMIQLIPKFPFVWKRHFVPEENSAECVPACVAMCARYWNERVKSLGLPTTTTEWTAYFEKLRMHTDRGTDMSRIHNALKKLKSKKQSLSQS